VSGENYFEVRTHVKTDVVYIFFFFFFCIAAFDIGVDALLSTLLFVGGPNTCTPFHVDWSEAYNVGIAVDTSKPGQTNPLSVSDAAIARWFFVPPSKVASVASTLKKEKFSALHLTTEDHRTDMEEIGCIVVDQLPGQCIYVPPGWLHAVVNLRACFKIAWDCVFPANVPRYFTAWREIHTKVPLWKSEDVSIPDGYVKLSQTALSMILPVLRDRLSAADKRALLPKKKMGRPAKRALLLKKKMGRPAKKAKLPVSKEIIVVNDDDSGSSASETGYES
jgi:hypothetical protein